MSWCFVGFCSERVEEVVSTMGLAFCPKAMLPGSVFSGYFGEYWTGISQQKNIVWSSLLTRKSLEQHGKSLSRNVQICGAVHDCDDFGNDWVLRVSDPSTKADDGHNAGRVALKVLHIVLRSTQQVVGNYLTFIILEIAIPLHLLDANTLMHELSLYSESVSLSLSRCNHIDEIVLTRAELCKHEHTRTRAIDASPLVE